MSESPLTPLPVPLEILIGGIPGSYKSSLALRLAVELRLSLAGTDQLRALARRYDSDPLLQGKTHDRYKLFGGAEEFLLEGFLGQCGLMQPPIRAVRDYHRQRGEGCVIEGVHVVPGMTDPAQPGLMLILSLDSAEKQLERMLMKRRYAPLMEQWTRAKAQESIRIQKMLVDNARREGAVVADASGTFESVVNQAKKVITGEFL